MNRPRRKAILGTLTTGASTQSQLSRGYLRDGAKWLLNENRTRELARP
jgi:hypothetical protein